MKSRDASIDLLRFLGLSLIILAHVSPNDYILQIRTFDVPLMFFVSGLAYSGRTVDLSSSFFIHRIKRLLIPVYIFITAYYLTVTIYNYIIGSNSICPINDALKSYLLIGGIGYLWIIRVFLIIGILTPFIQLIESRIENNWLLFALTICWLFVWGIIIENTLGTNNLFVKEYIFYAAGYSVLFLWGLRIKKVNSIFIKQFIIITCFMFFSCMATIIYYNNWHKYAINAYKYPPRHYYILYGLFMSVICYYMVRKVKVRKLPSLIDFIGKNTIWIYLYHIPVIMISDKIQLGWIARYIVLYSSAVFLCYFQITITNLFSKKYKFEFFKYLKG